MGRYRKLPVEVEAHQTGISYGEDCFIFWWCGAYKLELTTKERDPENADKCLKETVWVIHSLEGELIIRPGDWIIQGVAGEFYPCKPEIFEVSYEEVINV